LKALLARKRQFKGPKPCLEYLEGAAGPKVQFKGPKSCLEYIESAAGPKVRLEGPKSYLKYHEGAADPKVRLKGPKSYLEYLVGAAGPKIRFEGPKSYLEYLEGAAGPKGQFEYHFKRKFPRRGKCFAKNRIIEKLYVYSDGTKERSTTDLEGKPVERPSECEGYIPLRLERSFANLCPLNRKESTFPKERVIADDMLRRVVTSSSAGMA
jgi:hypothetical protein